MENASRELILGAFAELAKELPVHGDGQIDKRSGGEDGAKALPEAELRSLLAARGVPEEEVGALLASACVDGLVEHTRLVQFLSQSAPQAAVEARGPRVVAVCGGSCSGKSTIASRLAAELNGAGGDVKAICADDFFVFDQYLTDNCPTKCIDGRVWKDWESTASIDWAGLVQAVQKAAQAPDCPPYLVVEGFLLLATPESRSLFHAAIQVTLSKSECWRRRRGRAESMAHLPAGLSNSDEERNYEVLPTYILSHADPASFLSLAAQRHPEDGELAWLRLYFEEVIWPTGVEQEAAFGEASAAGMPVLQLDGETPAGKEEWQKARFPEALAFLNQMR